MAEHPTDFLTLARTADAWSTDPGRLLDWMGIDGAALLDASPPARDEMGRRLADLRIVAAALRTHGFAPSWKRCTQDPLPGMAGRTIADHVAQGHTDRVIEVIRASAAGVFA